MGGSEVSVVDCHILGQVTFPILKAMVLSQKQSCLFLSYDILSYKEI